VPEPHDAATTAAADPLTGRLLAGRYRLLRPIANGGMAAVWEATDQTLARRVAVKLLHPHLASDASFVQRFRAEAVAAARLSHPSIVSVYDTFTADGVDAIVMELVVGTTMREDLDAHGPLRMEAVLAIGTQVADALGAAHAAGLVHRDVKPANILLSADGRVLVADFGIAKAAEGTDLTTAGAMVGTAKYLAPEQVEGGPIDGRADIYALGVVLYEAITGEAPFVESTDAATALARLHRYPRPPRELRPDMPPAVEAVVMQAMARDRDHRFASAAALRTALLRAGADPRRAPDVAIAANTASPASPAQPMAAAPPPAPRPLSPPPPPPARPAVPPPGLEPTPTASPIPRRRRGRTTTIVLVLLLLAGVAAAFSINATRKVGSTVAAAGATSFDPQGDNGTEREDLVANAIDGDPATAWRSEQYRDPDDLAGKDGIGLIVELTEPAELTELDVITPEGGWSAQVHVASGTTPDQLEGWGAALDRAEDADAGTTTFDLDGRTGDRVLVWFTRLAPSGTVQVSELVVRAR
jgi:serine/threonine-protein kinase